MRTPSTQALPPALLALARPIAERLAVGGHRTWIVGGAVRDLALERPPKDLDLTSDATPDEVEALFPDAVDVGRQFGTLLLSAKLPDGKRAHAEHTTFRTDSVYRDGRRPEAVNFGSSLEEDAERRDFTCNALYLDPLNGEIADPTGGVADLRAGLLRAVGNPRERFREDALRILRLARFASSYGLRVDPATAAGASSAIGGLSLLPAERIVGELRRMGQGTGAPLAAEHLVELGWIPALGPAGTAACPARLNAVQALPREASWVEWWGILAGPLPLGANSLAVRSFAEEYRLSREEQDALQAMHNAAATLAHPMSGADLARLARSPFGVHAERVVSVAQAAAELCPAPHGDQLEALRTWLARDPQELHPAPLLSAQDLQDLGIPRGPELGRWIKHLESAQLEGRIATRSAAEQAVRSVMDDGPKGPSSARREDLP